MADSDKCDNIVEAFNILSEIEHGLTELAERDLEHTIDHRCKSRGEIDKVAQCAYLTTNEIIQL